MYRDSPSVKLGYSNHEMWSVDIYTTSGGSLLVSLPYLTHSFQARNSRCLAYIDSFQYCLRKKEKSGSLTRPKRQSDPDSSHDTSRSRTCLFHRKSYISAAFTLFSIVYLLLRLGKSGCLTRKLVVQPIVWTQSVFSRWLTELAQRCSSMRIEIILNC